MPSARLSIPTRLRIHRAERWRDSRNPGETAVFASRRSRLTATPPHPARGLDQHEATQPPKQRQAGDGTGGDGQGRQAAAAGQHHQRCQEQQRRMDMGIEALRGHVRKTLAMTSARTPKA